MADKSRNQFQSMPNPVTLPRVYLLSKPLAGGLFALALALALAAAVFAMVGAGGVTVAYAQSDLPAPGNVNAVNGPNPGTAVVSWDAATGAAWYRIGWVAEDDVEQAIADDTDVLARYVFAAVPAGQTSYTVTGLQPGEGYYFTVSSAAERFGPASATEITTLTLNTDDAACPTPGTGTTPLPQAPVGGDYDADNDGLIEIRSITQLDAIRYDLDGDGASEDDAYAAAFPGATSGMGCPSGGCTGYELAADLGDPSSLSPVNWAPIGYWNSDSDYAFFNATFDGNGHTITNLSISRQNRSHVGLFGVTGTDSVIKGVGLLYVNVVGSSYAGSLVGINNGTITGSYATGPVAGGHQTGGLVGSNGGIITASYATGPVVGLNSVGGLVGINNGTITASYATGSAAGDDRAGGLVGSNGGTVTASYATGSAAGGDYVGGLVGRNDGTISTSYATGSVTGGYFGIGGLVGSNVYGFDSGAVTASYWNTETSGLSGSRGGVGLTTAELQSPTSATGIYATWNPGWWDFGTSSQYPVLKVRGLSVAAQRGGTAGGEIPASTPSTADRAALVALYNATDGPSWTSNDGWLSDAPLGEWYGVTTDGSGRVTELFLWNKGLNGTIPAELGSLARLTDLRLGENQLTGPIPPELGELSNLTVLNLGDNRLTGNIPDQIRNLTILKVLSLDNELTGPVPAWLGDLSDLEQLNLGNNRLVGTIPPALGNLTDLEVLYLSGNDLTGCVPAGLKDVPANDFGALGLPVCGSTPVAQSTDYAALAALYNSTGGATSWDDADGWLSDAPIGQWHGVTTDADGRIIELDLAFNRLSGTIPAELGSLAKLQRLHLGHNQLTGPIPLELGGLSHLAVLSLKRNDLNGSIPAALNAFNNLEALDLSDNNLEGTIPAEIRSLAAIPNLRILNLGNNEHLSGSIPTALGGLVNLTHLLLEGNDFSGSIPDQLGNLKNLGVLELGDNRLSGEMPGELGRLSRLTNLELQNNELEGEIPTALADLGNLSWLRLSGNDDLTGCVPEALLPALGIDFGRTGLRFCGEVTLEAPTGLTARPGGPGEVILNWNPGANATVHQVMFSESQGEWEWWPSDLPHDAQEMTVSKLDEELRYSFRVRAGQDLSRNEVVWSNWVTVDNAVAGAPKPAPPANRGSVEKDRAALVALYDSAGGEDWDGDKKENWGNTNADLDDWYGVTTDHNGRVTELNLSGGRLCGEIPPALGDLTELTLLNLSDNTCLGFLGVGNTPGLKENIPSELGNLSKLQTLNLSDNGLSGRIPSALGDLETLEKLDLSDNELSGSLPTALGNLVNLGHMNLSSNELTGALPDELGKLVDLKHIDLSRNRSRSGLKVSGGLTGQFPLELAASENLGYIDLSHNLFDGRLEDLMDAFASRATNEKHPNTFTLKIAHNEWEQSAAANKKLASWDDTMTVVNPGNVTLEHIEYFRKFKSQWDTSWGIVNKVLTDGKTPVFGTTKLVCGLADHGVCQDVLAIIDRAKSALVKTRLDAISLYYGITILENPLFQDFQDAIIIGLFNGWNTEQIADYFAAPYTGQTNANWSGYNHHNICYHGTGVPKFGAGHKNFLWCGLCEKFSVAVDGGTEKVDTEDRDQLMLVTWCARNTPD